MLVDSHCHLDRLDLFGDEVDLNATLDRARARGIGAFLAIGVDLESSRNLLDLADHHRDIYVSAGVHPLQEGEIPIPGEDELVALAGADRVVAIGETGLDYHYAEETREWQKASFITHLRAARRAGKPLVVHTRDAREDTLSLIRQHGCTERAGVLHCFTENWEMARAAIDLNYYISFSGIITFRNAGELREVVGKVPIDRILVETDSPWLAPVPYRGKANVPGNVVEVARMVAEVKGLSPEAVAEATTENFCRLFAVTPGQ